MAANDLPTKETLPERPDPPGVAPLALRITGAPARPAYVRLDGKCRIGSGSDGDVVVDHPMVSRAHVEVEATPQGAAVRDLGSRNGTTYLGQRLQHAVLSPGASFQIGPVTVTVGMLDDALAGDPPYEGDAYRDVIGRSPAMKRLFSVLVRLERWLVPVLLGGESGAGKEKVARAIHDASGVARGPFVCLNCGALPRELIGSELFGHRRGAFTGATENRRGAFEAADGGTLFLDEIGELPLDLQPVLLRVLETGEIQRVGDDAPQRVEVRIVAATNRDLDADVLAGRFREDLLFRLAVVRLVIITGESCSASASRRPSFELRVEGRADARQVITRPAVGEGPQDRVRLRGLEPMVGGVVPANERLVGRPDAGRRMVLRRVAGPIHRAQEQDGDRRQRLEQRTRGRILGADERRGPAAIPDHDVSVGVRRTEPRHHLDDGPCGPLRICFPQRIDFSLSVGRVADHL
ncbi:MAG: sigma-54-dependent Fis family transcriptional regulator [Polyangiaceae bacterium]